MVFEFNSMDLAFLILLFIPIIKFSLFKDKESSGLKWILFGGLVCLMEAILPILDLSKIIFNSDYPVIIGDSIGILSFLFILIGSIKLAIELSK